MFEGTKIIVLIYQFTFTDKGGEPGSKRVSIKIQEETENINTEAGNKVLSNEYLNQNEDEIKKQLQDDAKQAIEEILDNRNEKIDPRTKQELVELILNQKHNSAQPAIANIDYTVEMQDMSPLNIALLKQKLQTVKADNAVKARDNMSLAKDLPIEKRLSKEKFHTVNVDDTVEVQDMSSMEDELLKAIIDILEGIPKFSGKTNYQRKTNAEFSARLIEKFKELQGRNLPVNDRKMYMNEYINAALDNIAKKSNYSFDPKTKNILATNLLTKMLEFIDFGEDITSRKDESSGKSDKKATAQFLKSLKSKLDEFKTRRMSNEKMKIAMLVETKKRLDSILKQRNETLDDKIKNHLAEVLLITLLKSQEIQTKKDTPKTLDDLAKILAEYSIHSAEHIKRKIIRRMQNTIRASEKGYVYKSMKFKDRLMMQAADEINKLLEDYAETLTPAVKERIIKNLVNEVYEIYEKEKNARAEEFNVSTDDLHSSSESLNDLDKKQEKSVNRQVAAWFGSAPYKSSNALEKRIIGRLTQNLKTIKNRDLSSREVRKQIARESRYFSDDIAEVTGERVDVKQKDKLIQKLLTDSNIDIPKEINADSSFLFPVNSKDRKQLSGKLTFNSNRNLKFQNHVKKKLSINDTEDSSWYKRRQKSKSKDTDSTEISEYDYNGRRISRRKVEPKYVVTGNKIKSNTKQKKYFGPSSTTEKLKQTTSKTIRELSTKKCTSAQKENRQDINKKNFDELECESIISEEEIAKLFDEDYVAFKQVKRESKENEVGDDVLISSPSEDEILQYETVPSETDYESKKVSQQIAKKKNACVHADNKITEAKKYASISTIETSDIEKLKNRGIRKNSLACKESPDDRPQRISTICNKIYNRRYKNRSPETLNPQSNRRIIERSSNQSPVEPISKSPERHRFEDRSNVIVDRQLCNKSKGNY